MIRNQVIRQTKLEIEIRSLMYKMPVSQSLFVDDLKIHTLKIIKQFIDAVRIERVLRLSEVILIDFIKQIFVAPQSISEFLLHDRVKIVPLRISETQLIETVANVSGKHLVRDFARQHHRNSATPGSLRKSHRTGVISFFDRTLAVIDHRAQTFRNLRPPKPYVV